jgi:hypothetical protein
MFLSLLIHRDWKFMQRDQFIVKIIKWANYYQNEYTIIKLCTKISYFLFFFVSPRVFKIVQIFLFQSIDI